MDSDTDSECELPPGWEKCLNNDQTTYINHINNTTQMISPMKLLSIDNDDSLKYTKYNKSCAFNRSRQKSEKFIQKYDSFSTSEQVIIGSNLSSKLAIVIGGCSGIGLEIVHQLISKNCLIILGCPDIKKCSSDLIMKIGHEYFIDFVTIFHLDLTSFQSVKMFCNLVLNKTSDANMIVFSAAIMCPPFVITRDGFESSVQINVLSQFYIQETLLSTFALSQCECRVVWLTCESHRAVKDFKPTDLQPSLMDYNGFHVYSLTSLCKIILVNQSKKRWDLRHCNSRPLFFACHPGNVVHGTNIARYHSFIRLMFWLFSPFTKTLSQAASTPLLCCISSSIKKFSGTYFNNGCLCQPSELAYNNKCGEILWQYLTKINDQFQGF